MANHIIALLRSVYRWPCVDHQTLRNPVDLWLAGGGRYHRAVRRRISTPAEVLPRWVSAIEAEVIVPATRDIFWFGMYTGMRRGEIMGLCWDRVDLERWILRVEETKTGKPLELPITRQLAALLERRGLDASAGNGDAHRWVFPSTGGSGHVVELQHLYRRISRAAGTKFWFHGLRNVFITVAERELMLPRSLTKRLVNHARGSDTLRRATRRTGAWSSYASRPSASRTGSTSWRAESPRIAWDPARHGRCPAFRQRWKRDPGSFIGPRDAPGRESPKPRRGWAAVVGNVR